MNFPKELYHITVYDNFHSIMDLGLGAIAGKGIDWKNAKARRVYFIDFDPYSFLDGNDNLDSEQSSNLIDILGTILGNKNITRIALFTVESRDLYSTNLRRDIKNTCDWIYDGVIHPDKLSYNIFEISYGPKNEFGLLSDEDNLYARELDDESENGKEGSQSGSEIHGEA